MSAKRVAKKLMLAGARAVRLDRLAPTRLEGIGTIFTSHRMIAPGEIVLDPSQAITSDALSLCIEHVRRRGYDIISLDQAVERLTQSRRGTKFVCFTFDDGYRDNLTLGLPIFKRHGAPFCLYVTTGFPDRQIHYWWRALERLVLEHDAIELNTGNAAKRLAARTMAEKRAAYSALCKLVASCRAFDAGRDLISRYRVDPQLLLHQDALSWAELAILADDPLVTIGAHTVSHPLLRDLDAASARGEITQSKKRLEEMLDRPVNHFAYPFGICDRRDSALAQEIGFRTAVTMDVCNILQDHRHHLWSLPRISLDNTAARAADLDLHLSGLTAAFRMRLRHPAISGRFS